MVIIAIIVTVIGLLGVGGYFVWQNFFNEPETITVQPDDVGPKLELVETEEALATSTATATTITAATTPTTVSDGSYEITQWGLKGTYNGDYKAQYQIEWGKNGDQFAKFTTPEFTGDANGCQVASIKKFGEKPDLSTYYNLVHEFRGVTGDYYAFTEHPITIKSINGTYYSFGPYTGACSNSNSVSSSGLPNNTVQTEMEQDLGYLFATLKAK